ncbi:hypothetical protein NLJ89_g6457 [Agrocybe chaxingu]|uniref:Uncharacterized protein n=1 Tax=Agrocybe chaxingu TaxID=84603 RepID=A0A9W8MSP0_9AGAR|nr:hypothetical protein NLJ89_g6457 [Agrocybe chaxingu]
MAAPIAIAMISPVLRPEPEVLWPSGALGSSLVVGAGWSLEYGLELGIDVTPMTATTLGSSVTVADAVGVEKKIRPLEEKENVKIAEEGPAEGEGTWLKEEDIMARKCLEGGGGGKRNERRFPSGLQAYKR